MWLVNKLKGFIFLVLVFVSSLLGSLVFGGFLLPVFFLRPALYRHLYDYMIGLWLWFAAVSFFSGVYKMNDLVLVFSCNHVCICISADDGDSDLPRSRNENAG